MKQTLLECVRWFMHQARQAIDYCCNLDVM